MSTYRRLDCTWFFFSSTYFKIAVSTITSTDYTNLFHSRFLRVVQWSGLNVFRNQWESSLQCVKTPQSFKSDWFIWLSEMTCKTKYLFNYAVRSWLVKFPSQLWLGWSRNDPSSSRQSRTLVSRDNLATLNREENCDWRKVSIFHQQFNRWLTSIINSISRKTEWG